MDGSDGALPPPHDIRLFSLIISMRLANVGGYGAFLSGGDVLLSVIVSPCSFPARTDEVGLCDI